MLSPNPSNLTDPLQYSYSQDFSICSYIQMNCNSTSNTTISWSIMNCTSSCSSIAISHADIVTTLSELRIPEKTLAFGTYELRLTVVLTTTTLVLQSTVSTFVQINPSTTNVNMLRFGTSMIVHGHLKDLILDPGTYSVDPDKNVFDATVRNSISIESLFD